MIFAVSGHNVGSSGGMKKEPRYQSKKRMDEGIDDYYTPHRQHHQNQNDKSPLDYNDDVGKFLSPDPHHGHGAMNARINAYPRTVTELPYERKVTSLPTSYKEGNQKQESIRDKFMENYGKTTLFDKTSKKGPGSLPSLPTHYNVGEFVNYDTQKVDGEEYERSYQELLAKSKEEEDKDDGSIKIINKGLSRNKGDIMRHYTESQNNRRRPLEKKLSHEDNRHYRRPSDHVTEQRYIVDKKFDEIRELSLIHI